MADRLRLGGYFSQCLTKQLSYAHGLLLLYLSTSTHLSSTHRGWWVGIDKSYFSTSPPVSPSPLKERGRVVFKGLRPFKLPVDE